MTNERKPIIGIIGAGECSKEQQEMAYEAGKRIAEKGGIVVCGGLGGIMEGAARGARAAGGMTLGIIPSSQKDDANEYIDIVIPTGLGEARNLLVVHTADALIAFPGKYGTLSEMAFALQAGKPLISLSNWKPGGEVIQVNDPIEAAELALEFAGGTK
jgi:uncharacterized protein (TIGR00725 family)